MSGYRFIFTLIALLSIFIGGGYLIDHWDKPAPKPVTGPGTGTADTASAPAPATTAETRSVEDQNAPTTEVETRVRKEFDAAAADAAAEVEAKAATVVPGSEPEAATAASRSIALRPELLTLDTAQLSATTVSVIAGKAPMGTEVTLLGNGTPLGQTTADESGAWTIVVEEPMAPGTYKLKLSAVSPAGGAAVVRDAGEVTVEAPADETASTATPAPAVASDPKASEIVPKDEAGTLAAPQATSAESQTSAPAPAPAIEITVPAATVEIVGVPPDLSTPIPPAAPESEAEPAKTTLDGAVPAVAEIADSASSAPKAEAATETPIQVAENDDSLATQAGEVADSITTMFTDWLNATKEQAEEAAKSFTLASASYRPNAEGPGVLTLSGRGPAKARVQITVDKQTIGSTEIAESGRWLLEVTRPLQPGEHTARAEILAVDGTLIAGRDLTFVSSGPPEIVASAPATTGETGAAQEPTATTPLVITSVGYEAMGAKKGRVTVSGNAEPGASVAIAADGRRIGTATATEQGSWELASDTWLDVGDHAIRAERLAGDGEVIERTLSEFVRPPSGLDVASATPDESQDSSATAVTEAEPQSVDAKPRKRKVRSAARKRTKLAAKSHRAGKRANRSAAAGSSGYHIVNVVRGKSVSRVRVRAPGHKGRIMSFVVRKGPGWYRVRRGDSLWRIADHFYGDGRSYPVIAGFNARRVPVPDRLRPRQRLRVP